MGGTFQLLTIDEVVEINRHMIDRFGGIFIHGNRNLANLGSLEHALEEAQGSLFGQELYPTAVGKAGLIGWRIIQGHVFNDGNKRTGLECCRLILELNGYHMPISREAIDVSLRIARGEMSQAEFISWVEEIVTLIER